jgi:23S rRNA pseudouridine2605 synthase
MTSEGRPGAMRLQKVLAGAGVGSRRACEILIEQGRVTIGDQETVALLGARVDPAVDLVRVDGRRINLRPQLRYLVLNKPVGVVSAMSDPQGRPTVGDYVRDEPERVFHVGRLDADTEGLLILTNDGDFAQRLAHPSYELVKTYVAEVEGRVSPTTLKQLQAGIELEDGPVALDDCRILDAGPDRSLVQVSLHEGRNRIVRRTLAEVGHPVLRLVRTSIGPVRLGDQRPGTLRQLNGAELGEFYRLLGL